MAFTVSAGPASGKETALASKATRSPPSLGCASLRSDEAPPSRRNLPLSRLAVPRTLSLVTSPTEQHQPAASGKEMGWTAWWGQPPGQLMEPDLSLPQAPAEMTQLPMIKAEPQEVNQFLKVTPGECIQTGPGRQHPCYLGSARPTPSTTSPLSRTASPRCLHTFTPPVPFLPNL